MDKLCATEGKAETSSPAQERNLKNQFISVRKCSHLASLYNSCTLGNFQMLKVGLDPKALPIYPLP